MTAPFSAAAAIAIVGLLGVGACSGSNATRATSTTPASSTSTPATLTPAVSAPGTPPFTTNAIVPTPPAAAPGGGPIPAGFQPLSFSALSNSEWWLLGDTVCARKPCTSLVRTTDGGASFVGLPAPPVAFLGGVSDPSAADPTNANSVSAVRFADPSDGFAFRTVLWATHDGGGHWHQVTLAGQVNNLEAADGYVFAVAGGALYRSPATSDNWSRLGPANLSESLAVHGADVVTQTAYSQTSPSRLLVSHDHGGHFQSYLSPDVGLGCSFNEPVSAVIWAGCTTGMQSRVLRSSDGGVSFSPLAQGPPFVNSAMLAAVSSTSAVVAGSAPAGVGGLSLTTDSGRTYQPTGPILSAGSEWVFIGFTDALHGAAIATSGSGSSKTSVLYRSADGGHAWSAVRIGA